MNPNTNQNPNINSSTGINQNSPHIDISLPGQDRDTFPPHAFTSGQGETKNKHVPILAIIVVTVIAFAGTTGVATYMVMKNMNSNSIFANTDTPDESDVNIVEAVQTTGNESEEDVLRQLDEKVSSSSSDPSDYFDNLMTKIAFLFDFEEYDSVKTTLDGISTEGLSNFQLFQVYTSYARYYSIIEDNSSAAQYEALAAEAESKYFAE